MSVCVKIKGGLGNQLFQYALGKKISRDLNAPLVLDTSYFSQKNFNGNDERKFELDSFNISANHATSSEIPFLAKIPFADRVLKRLPKLSFTKMIFEEHSSPSLKIKRTPIYLDGYWQSHSHLEPVADELRAELTVNKIPIVFEDVLNDMQNSNSVSVHIRRGDYISNSKNQSLFSQCDNQYYSKAIQKLENEESTDLKFFIFSDDSDWVEKNIELPENCVFVDKIAKTQPAVSLFLLSNCKHHIIANSTFSWWGAWLSKNNDKKIIAPKNWFINGWSTEALIPKSWVLL